jgi:hypothetical protein
MKYISLEKTLPDNRIVNFHALLEIDQLDYPNVTFKIGSWNDFTQMLYNTSPSYITNIPFVATNQAQVVEKTQTILEDFIRTPGWESGIIFDTSIP